MSKIISLIFNNPDKYFSYPLIFTLISVIVSSIFLTLTINKLPSQLPLFYSLPWGESQLIPTTQIFLLPIIMMASLLINFFISSQLHQSQIILKRMLTLNTIAIDVILLITIFKVLTIFI